MVGKSALCFGGSLPRLGQKSRKQTKESLQEKDKDRSDNIADASGSNNTPPNSHSSQETPPGSNKSILSANNNSINTTSESTSSSCADNTANSYDSTRPQPSASTHQAASDSNSSSSGNGNSELPKQRPGVPRIIIPDGTSINLSTPPTTPRQQPREIRSRQMPIPIWPDRFIQLRDRMRASGHMALFNRTKPTAPTSTEHDAQADHAIAKEPDTTAVEEAETTPNTAAQEADPVSTHLSFSPAFGILGIPHYGDGDGAESETSSQRRIWRDYDDDNDEDESYGGWCSKERWHHVFCTLPGLTNTGKRLVTTTLGLVVILALALTALGKIRHPNRVSDVIPESLEGKVYEAQVMVIEDFHNMLPNALEKRQEGKATKMPFWDHPLGAGCFQQLCEIEAWKEFIAFMNPESFGIQLQQNWPSLCSSCIEISRNKFVYRTTVRVLGDLSQCAPTSSPPPPPARTPLPQTSASTIQISSKTGHVPPPSKKTLPQHHGHGTHTLKNPTVSKNTSISPTRVPDRKKVLLKRQVKSPSRETFPALIIDPATFNNLTEYDSVNAIQSMEQLRVQFRFVLCDD
ncbi:hypothetical protein BG000_002164 [Podila horticola]|nr:hypothetical protein BG000_002164 [Podila horticola]